MWVVDIAGVPVAVEATETWLRRAFDAAVLAEPCGDEPQATVTLHDRPADIPDRPPDHERHGVELWLSPGGGIVARLAALVIAVSGREAVAAVPDEASAELLEPLSYLLLCWLLAPVDRHVLHAAAVDAGPGALLVLGHTGSGKSTTVIAALEAGWPALSDDLVAIEHRPGCEVLAHGIRQPPAAPLDIGGALLTSGIPLEDVRNRSEVRADVLSAGGRPVVGLVLVGHSDSAGGALARVAGHEVVGMVVQSFPGVVDAALRERFLPVAAALSRMPVWRLGHSSRPERRREVAVRLLERCRDEISGAERRPG